MLATVTTELGRPDLLVNNVGGSRSVAPVATSDPDRWLADVQLNLVSTYLCSRAVLPSMIERERGRIINIASNGAVGAWPYLSAYAASKAGVVSLTSTLAQEVRAHGIIVFALHPGHVGTRLVEHLAQQLAPYQRGNGEHAQLSSPDAAARLCVFLASGAADQFSGHFFADATDTPRRFLWRTIARLGMIRRDMASLGVTRRLSREAGPDGSVHPAARRAGLRFTDSLRRLVTVLAVGLTRVEIEHGILVLGHL
jgi:short-subunit dehydrogenase